MGERHRTIRRVDKMNIALKDAHFSNPVRHSGKAMCVRGIRDELGKRTGCCDDGCWNGKGRVYLWSC